jgi:hypothetical protein
VEPSEYAFRVFILSPVSTHFYVVSIYVVSHTLKATPFELARNLVKKSKNTGSVNDAMKLLWERAPKEAALHGVAMHASLKGWHELCHPDAYRKIATTTTASQPVVGGSKQGAGT